MTKNWLVAVFVGLALVGCANVKGEVLTASNHDKVAEDIGKSRLTDDEKKFFVGGIARSGLSNAFDKSGGAYQVDGKSVQAVIDEQKQWIADNEAREAAEKAAQQKAEAARQAVISELRKAVQVLVISKHDDPANFSTAYETGQEAHGERIAITIREANHSSKVITEFKGMIKFENHFGELIKEINVDETAHLRPGQMNDEGYTHDFNQFESEDAKFRDVELSDMKTEWIPLAVSYADGATIVAPEGSNP